MAKNIQIISDSGSTEPDKILIVEDDKYTRLIIEKLLTKNKFHVFLATNGQEALNIIGNKHPKVIIADWNMPVLNGLDLCKTVKKNDKFKTIYFILFTAKISLDDRVKGLDAGADDFLIKPTENEELLARVRTGIRVVNLQNELAKIEHDKALVEMACTMGHKISNPLNSLTFSLTALEDKLSGKQLKQLEEELNIVQLSVDKINKLVNELLRLEKPEMVDYNSETKMIKLD